MTSGISPSLSLEEPDQAPLGDEDSPEVAEGATDHEPPEDAFSAGDRDGAGRSNAPFPPALFARIRALAGGVLSQSMLVSFAVFACWAIQGVLLARLLGPEGRGEYQTATLFTQALLFAGLLGSSQGATRRAARIVAGATSSTSAEREAQLAALRRSSLQLALLTGAGTAIVSSVLAIALPSEKLFLVPWCVVGSLFLIGEHLRLALLSVDQGSASWRRYNVARVAAAACLPLILLVLLATGVHSMRWAVAGSVLAPLLALALHLWLLGGEGFALRELKKLSIGELFREGLPQAGSIAVGTLYGKLDSALMMFIADTHEQGLYAAAVSAVVVLTVAPTTFGLFSFNAGADPTRKLSLREVAKNAAMVFALQAFSAAAFAVILGPAITLVFGAKFDGALPFALALIPAHAVCGCGLVVEGYLRGRGRPGYTMAGALSGAAMMCLVVLLLRERLAEMAVPWAVVAGHSTACVVMFASMLYLVRVERRETTA